MILGYELVVSRMVDASARKPTQDNIHHLHAFRGVAELESEWRLSHQIICLKACEESMISSPNKVPRPVSPPSTVKSLHRVSAERKLRTATRMQGMEHLL